MYNANENELDILKFWRENQTFEKSISERPDNKPYVFYDGPPFATGLPHYGHIVASLMKDVVPRYFTMQGYRVERKWGWDCHGLPVENIIEKELNLQSKKDILNYGIGAFNEACRDTVLKYAAEWKIVVERMGRWVDMTHDYKTMDVSFMESVWWVFGELWKNGLIYEGYKAMHVCPRCVTPLSNFEVTQGYKDVTDISVFAKFRIRNQELGIRKIVDGPVDILAWTTTPWTLPGNVLLAVGNDISYSIVKTDTGNFIVASDLVGSVIPAETIHSRSEISGKDLVGLEYEPLFPYYAETKNAFRVVAADFVTTNDGTGIVHIAPAFGEDDYQVGVREEVPLVQHVTMEGKMVPGVTEFAGMDVKPKDDPTKTDIEIIKWLAHNGKLFAKKKLTHSYPHCWRCDTPLLNYATSSWFVRVTDLKDELLANNVKTNWVPDHVKDGRFGKWLEGARDWAISRSRFWGTPLPVWRCGTTNQECGEVMVVGSVEELEKLSGQKVTDLHKHLIDPITFPCTKCGGVMKRIPDVLDCWFESGSMPYGEVHYPFENKAKFEAGFPARFIAEGQDQTRGWFYTLHVLATALTRGKKPSIPDVGATPAFKNVIVNGIVLAEDGKKMSKRLKNYPDPMVVLEKYGADAMRYYLVSSPVMYAESLNFSEAGVREMYNKVVNMLWNVVTFYQLYAESGIRNQESGMSTNVLDKWILAKLNLLVKEVTEQMEAYHLAEASRPIMVFIDELSTWYLRRSRDRFKGGDEADKQAALATMREVLLKLSKVMAPFTPFIAEKIYQESGKQFDSVHLEAWPVVDEKMIDEKVLEDMAVARKVVEMGLALRAEAGVKVRQPLSQLVTASGRDAAQGGTISNEQLTIELKQIIADELNVKEVVSAKELTHEGWKMKEDGGVIVMLNVELTDELKKEGLLREVVRTVNQMRKDAGLTVQDTITLIYKTEDSVLKSVFADYADQLKKQVLAVNIEWGEGVDMMVDERSVQLKVIK
ncbi:MAG: isoleucine--tRNA ligase [Candidatus Magasanikbacteria bacterium]|nr:isoleucine--tRNA ligase [Candidatus Magasanikbacteria bacterium]